MDNYDVVIVGGGLAALTAGLFAARGGRSTLVLVAGAPGGHLLSIDKIEDFPGFLDPVAGYDLCPTVQEQAANAGAAFQMAEAERLEADGDGWRVLTNAGRYAARAVIIATGSRPKTLGIPGEERLQGRGISHCATCDGPLYRGRTVGVVGGGDSALQEALTVADFAEQVLVFHRGETFSAQQTYQQRVMEHPKVEVHRQTIVVEALGDDRLSGVRLRDAATDASRQIELAGLFVYVGLAPNTAFVQDVLPLDAAGHIPTDIWLRTPVRGLFAAGDVRQNAAGQAITAAGDGATAAIAAHRYLDSGTWSGDR